MDKKWLTNETRWAVRDLEPWQLESLVKLVALMESGSYRDNVASDIAKSLAGPDIRTQQPKEPKEANDA